MVEFGGFGILADGRPIRLGGRAFDVLMALIEASGAIAALRKGFNAGSELIPMVADGLPVRRRDPRALRIWAGGSTSRRLRTSRAAAANRPPNTTQPCTGSTALSLGSDCLRRRRCRSAWPRKPPPPAATGLTGPRPAQSVPPSDQRIIDVQRAPRAILRHSVTNEK